MNQDQTSIQLRHVTLSKLETTHTRFVGTYIFPPWFVEDITTHQRITTVSLKSLTLINLTIIEQKHSGVRLVINWVKDKENGHLNIRQSFVGHYTQTLAHIIAIVTVSRILNTVHINLQSHFCKLNLLSVELQ